jgi:hypothetical protein
METTIITTAGMAILILELVKWIIRKVKKEPTFVFPEKFYMIALPVLNVLSVPLLALLEIPGVIMPTDWPSFGRLVVTTMLGTLASMIGYDYTLGAMKNNIKWAKVLTLEDKDIESVG